MSAKLLLGAFVLAQFSSAAGSAKAPKAVSPLVMPAGSPAASSVVQKLRGARLGASIPVLPVVAPLAASREGARAAVVALTRLWKVNEPGDVMARLGAMIGDGSFNEASEAIEQIATSEAYVQQASELFDVLARLRFAKQQSYERGEAERQAALNGEASALAARGRLAGWPSASTRRQERSDCLFWALDNALSAAGRGDLARKVWVLYKTPASAINLAPSERGVTIGNVTTLIQKLGLSSTLITRESFSDAPRRLEKHLKSGRPAVGTISIVRAETHALEEWRHVVHLRSVFYSRKARSWIVGVQDSEKGRVEYYTWKRLANLIDSIHLIAGVQ